MWRILETNVGSQIDFSQEIDVKLFQKIISKFVVGNSSSIIKISDIRLLESLGRRGSNNESYLVEYVLQKKDGSSKYNKIVAKQPSPNQKLYYHLKINEKYFSNIFSIKIPVIRYVDFNSGYIFRDFISGKNVDEIINQILLKKCIKDWQIDLFKKMGEGLAELNYNLNIIHGDSRTSNWIIEKDRNILYLIDWDVAGIGDPAYDLSKLIYSIGRKFSKILNISDLESKAKIINLFDQLCFALVKGYSKIDTDQLTIRNFSKYWIYYIFSVSPQIHERIFYYSKYSTKNFRIIKKILPPFPLKTRLRWLSKFLLSKNK